MRATKKIFNKHGRENSIKKLLQTVSVSARKQFDWNEKSETTADKINH